MKSFFVIVLPFVFSASLPADSLPESALAKCRNEVTNFKVSLTAAERVKLDLLNGVWTTEEPEKGISMQIQFNETGSADVIAFEQKGGVNFGIAFWEVEEFQGEAILLWTAKESQKTNVLRVQQICEGILLEDVLTQKQRYLTFHPLRKNKELSLLKTSLSGNWTSATYPFDIDGADYELGTTELMAGAFLEYKIEPDGTYQKSYGNKSIRVLETGTWELSKDGKYVLFHQIEEGSTEKMKATGVAKILHFDGDELVLENSLNSSKYDGLFSTERRAFAFVR